MNKKTAASLLPNLILILLISAAPVALRGQSILDKPLSVEFKQEALGRALEILSNKGNFYFSYNSAILKKDSLVTLSAQDKTIRQILDLLFNGHFEYKEDGNYIILRKLPPRSPPSGSLSPAMGPDAGTGVATIPGRDPIRAGKYTVNGVIRDDETGEGLSQASVYDQKELTATLTDEKGSFTLKLKNRSGSAALTVSKEFYEDKTIFIPRDAAGPVTIAVSPLAFARKMVTIGPQDLLLPDSLKTGQPDQGITRISPVKKDPIQVELTPMGRLLLSSRQKIQSINLKNFFVVRPYQLSLLPGLSTQGPLSSQIVNNLSLNVLGGYTGGLNGVELGGLLNIDKKQVRGFQASGFMNIVGGAVSGLQMAGFHNTVLDSLTGWQLAGFTNFTRKKLNGVQAAGFYNHEADSLRGAQLAGFANFSRKQVKGVQIAGFANVSFGETSGLQLSGFVNYTRRLKGVQVGIVNISDTTEGYSIGLVNITRKGLHEFSFFADEVSPLNFAFRSGNSKLYSILLAGLNTSYNNASYYFGFGLGHRFRINKTLTLNPELSSARVAPGEWSNFKYINLLNRLRLDMHCRLGKSISLYGGPSLAVYYADHDYTENGHPILLPHDGYPRFFVSGRTSGWIGWQAGINFF